MCDISFTSGLEGGFGIAWVKFNNNLILKNFKNLKI